MEISSRSSEHTRLGNNTRRQKTKREKTEHSSENSEKNESKESRRLVD